MIKFLTDEIRGFVAYISDNKIPPVELFVLPGYDTVEKPDGEFAFAVYVPSEKRIIVAEGVDPDVKSCVLQSVAHEYCHHIQNCEGRDFDEDEAEKFAELKFKQYWRFEKVED